MRCILIATAALFLSTSASFAMCGGYKSASAPQTTIAESGHPTSTPIKLPQTDKKS